MPNDEKIEVAGVKRALGDLFAQHLNSEIDQTVKDIAAHVGDQIFDVLKRNGMMMGTTAAAGLVGVLAAAFMVNQSTDFLIRSIEPDEAQAKSIRGAILGVFHDYLDIGLKEALAAVPQPNQEGAANG